MLVLGTDLFWISLLHGCSGTKTCQLEGISTKREAPNVLNSHPRLLLPHPLQSSVHLTLDTCMLVVNTRYLTDLPTYHHAYLIQPLSTTHLAPRRDQRCREVQAGYASSSLLISSPKELCFILFELSSPDTYAVSFNFVLRQLSFLAFKCPLPISASYE